MISRLFKKNELVLVLCTPQYCTLSWITAATPPKRLILNAYEHISFAGLELEKGILFNPTQLKHLINDFVQKNRLPNVSLAFTLSGAMIYDRLLLVQHNAQKKDLGSHFNQHWLWDCTYLCNYNDHTLFYVAGIPQALALQYKLISIALKIPLAYLTTERMALLQFYQFAKGATYRTTELSSDLRACNGIIEQLFNHELIYRVLTIAPTITIDSHQTWYHIVCASGLFLLCKEQ